MKILDLKEIKSVTLGAERVEKEGDFIVFRRFTKDQERFYEQSNLKIRIYSGSGIKLSFVTDSAFIKMKGETADASSRRFYSIHVCANDAFVGEITNCPDEKTPKTNQLKEYGFQLEKFDKTILLGEGEKHVEVYLPWSVDAKMEHIALSDGATVSPVRPSKRILQFGDSITQGYDARYQTNAYSNIVARGLGAEAFNKAIGGEQYCPGLIACPEKFKPDYITVAYGTNDWSGSTMEVFESRVTEFYRILDQLYKGVPTYVLAPIWRTSLDREKKMCAFPEVCKTLKKLTKKYDYVRVIDCFDFMPHDNELLADNNVHPNDQGFIFYAAGVLKAIKKLQEG